MPPEMRLHASHRDRVLAAIRAEPAPVRRELRVRVAVAWTAGLVLTVCVLVLAGGPELESRAPALTWATGFGAFTIALVGTQTLVWRRTMLGPARDVLMARALALPPLLFAWKVGWTAAHEDLGVWLAAPTELRCLLLGLALAIGPFTAAMVTRLATDPVQPRLSGLAIGLASGAWAWAFLDLSCRVGHPGHVALGHVAPVLLAGLVGTALGPRLLAPRTKPRP